MSTPKFSVLSPELVILVMHCLETPTDLFNFILTSKAHHQLFQASRESTLEAVIWNAIPPVIMPDALAACDASTVSWLWWKHFPSDCITAPPAPSASFLTSRKQFLEDYSNRPIQAHLRRSGHLFSLLKLWWIAHDFLLGFQSRAFVVAANAFPHLKSGWDDPISATERVRLLRAFFRFEVFRRLFPELAAIESDVSNNKDFVRFLSLFPRWEVEELLSIHEYLVSFAKDVYRETQDYLLDRMHSVGVRTEQEAAAQGILFERENIKDIKGGLDLGGWDVFQCQAFLTRRRFQYLVARGLPFLHWLARLPPNERILTLDVSLSLHCRRSFFEATFDAVHLRSPDVDCTAYAKTNKSSGWLWARRLGLVGKKEDILTRHILQQAGFVFWDADRLSGGWRLPETSRDAIQLTPRDYGDDDNDWNEEPTIEERFQNIIVPKGFFDDLKNGPDVVFKTDASFLDESEQLFAAPFSQEERMRYDIEY